MSDALAAALARTDHLSDFEGKAVRQVGIEIPGAAGGLREPMKIEPREFHQGDHGYLVLEWVVEKVRFEPIDKEDPGGDQRRVHVFGVEAATIFDGEPEVVRSQLDAQAERIRLAKEAAAGIERLPLDGADGGDPSEREFELAKEHAAGQHTELVDGCLACDAERDAAASEAGEGAEPPADLAEKRKGRGRG